MVVVAGRRAPRVDSFEPNLDIVARLAPVMPENVNIHPVALSNQSGQSNLWVPSGGAGKEGRSSLEPPTGAGSDWRKQPVATSRLDDFDLGDVGFVKIDVEGHELAVLQGSTDLLRTQRPTLMVEIEQHPDHQCWLDQIIVFSTTTRTPGSFCKEDAGIRLAIWIVSARNK